MQRHSILLVLVTGLSACSDGMTQQEREARDAKAVAMVEKAQEQRPPLEPIYPEPITFADIDRADLFGASCYMLHPSGGHMIALAMNDDGYIKRGGDMVRLAADKGSAQQPYETWSNYDGRDLSMRLRITGEGDQSGEETVDYPGELLLRDTFDREVFRLTGTVQCGA